MTIATVILALLVIFVALFARSKNTSPAASTDSGSHETFASDQVPDRQQPEILTLLQDMECQRTHHERPDYWFRCQDYDRAVALLSALPDAFTATKHCVPGQQHCVGIDSTYVYLLNAQAPDPAWPSDQGDVDTVILWAFEYKVHSHGYVYHAMRRAFAELGFKAYHFVPGRDDRSRFQTVRALYVITSPQDLGGDYPWVWHRSNRFCMHNSHAVGPHVPAGSVVYWRPCRNQAGMADGEPLNQFGEVWNARTRTLYMHYGTDLLKREVEGVKRSLTLETVRGEHARQSVHYVGTYANHMQPFIDSCQKAGLEFKLHTSAGTWTNCSLQQASSVSAVVQLESQLQEQYLPCRLFKNISYGRLPVTNNFAAQKVFPRVPCSEDQTQLLRLGAEAQKTWTLEQQFAYMDLVRDHFTYEDKAAHILARLGIR